MFEKSRSKMLIILTVVFLGCRLWYLDYSLWNDEIFGVRAARLGWDELVSFIRKVDGHPPLFYVLLKGWVAIGGESVLWLRLFPVLTSVVSLVPFYMLCRELRLSREEINLALALMAVNQYLITWSQNLRMYSLLLCFTLCSLWLFIKFINTSDRITQTLAGLSVVNVCLVYTHYFGWLVVGAESVYVLFIPIRKLRLFALSVTCVAICFVPWAYAVVKVWLNNEALVFLYRIDRPGWKGLVAHFGSLNGLFYSKMRIIPVLALSGAVLFAYPVFLWIWDIIANHRREEKQGSEVVTFWFLFLFAMFPTVLVYAVSELSPRSYWVQRHLIIGAVPYLMLVSVAVNRLRPYWVKKITVIAVLGWATLAGIIGMNIEKTSFEALVHQMIRSEKSQGPTIPVYALSGTTEHPIEYYVELAGDKRFQIRQREMDLLDGEHFWVAAEESPWQERRLRFQLASYLEENGYQIGEGFESGPEGKKAFVIPVWSKLGLEMHTTSITSSHTMSVEQLTSRTAAPPR
jgi:hypothetical protein